MEIESKFIAAARKRRSEFSTHLTSDGLEVTIKQPEYSDAIKLYTQSKPDSPEFLKTAAEILAKCIISPNIKSREIKQAMILDNPDKYIDEALISDEEVLYYLFPNPIDIIDMSAKMLSGSNLNSEGMKERYEIAKN
jgi:hypothetical protein